MSSPPTIEYKWENIQFVDEEWDTPQKIKRLNELDAEFNSLPIEKIRDIIK